RGDGAGGALPERGVADEDEVVGGCGQLGGVGLEERAEVGAAALLFAFDQQGDVDGQTALADVGPGAEGFEEGGDLAFVVNGAAGEDLVVADGGLEGRGFPEI